MGNYDGPSFYKQQHPKIKPIKNEQKSQKGKKNKYTLPKNVRTQDNLKEEARHYMKTPAKTGAIDPPPERYPFKSKKIPDSLQNLDGWKKPQTDKTLFSEVAARLQKEEHTYLLLADHLSDEMMQKLETKKAQQRHKSTEAKKVTPKEASKDSAAEEKAVKAQEVQKEVMKPSSGLHRSLSNIIAEEQKGIENSKLNSLFTSDKKS